MRTGKTVLLLTLVAVVALAGVLMKDQFIERWFLEQLDSKDTAVRDKAATKLAELGAVDAIPTLLALIRRQTTFDTKTVLRPTELANAQRPRRAFRMPPGGRLASGSRLPPRAPTTTPAPADSAPSTSTSYAQETYTVVPQDSGGWTMTYGSDVFCFEAPQLCLHLLDLVHVAGARAVPRLRRALSADDHHIR